MDSAKKSGGVKRKHRALSIAEKVEVLKKLDSGVSVRTICEIYSIGSSTVYDIKKQKEKLLKFFSDSGSKRKMFVRKSMSEGKSAELDQVLITWFKLRVNEGVEISGDLLKEQAKVFHEELGLQNKCDYKEGWPQRFKSRHGLQFRAVCGEKRSADKDAASAYVDEFAKLVSDEHLSPEQVYNADETVLFWRCTPKRTLTTEDAESPSGFKASKNRVTVMCCSNAVSTHRCKLLVIGKSPERNACTGSDEDESSEENEEDVRDRISIDRLIALTTELLAGLEQRSFKIARKQEEATAVSTLDNPLPSTSRQVEAVPVAEDVTVSDKDDNPDSPSAV
ncbi:tigger transposable element-derived protein 2-like [Homarus americanus]|uniref:tigger transposable element-derived protein 2-like n=1 Tax=Homarus americanus TaxID=6706 RepID=UPI001C445F1A|nr:tigger transposable element-derived protein 2-like [Homarus americanus]